MKKVLLDENLPKQLAKRFSNDLEVESVPDLGKHPFEHGGRQAPGVQIVTRAMIAGDERPAVVGPVERAMGEGVAARALAEDA